MKRCDKRPGVGDSSAGPVRPSSYRWEDERGAGWGGSGGVPVWGAGSASTRLGWLIRTGYYVGPARELQRAVGTRPGARVDKWSGLQIRCASFVGSNPTPAFLPCKSRCLNPDFPAILNRRDVARSVRQSPTSTPRIRLPAPRGARSRGFAVDARGCRFACVRPACVRGPQRHRGRGGGQAGEAIEGRPSRVRGRYPPRVHAGSRRYSTRNRSTFDRVT